MTWIRDVLSGEINKEGADYASATVALAAVHMAASFRRNKPAACTAAGDSLPGRLPPQPQRPWRPGTAGRSCRYGAACYGNGADGCQSRGNTRACLKIAFCKMCVTVCGEFAPKSGGVAGYADWFWSKFPAKWGVQIAGMNFQTRSKRPEGLSIGYRDDSSGSFDNFPTQRPSGSGHEALRLPR